MSTPDRYTSFDPFRLRLMAEFPTDDRVDLDLIIRGFFAWKSMPLEARLACFRRLEITMESEQSMLAELITREVGKPLTESISEIAKCRACIRHYLDFAPQILCRRNVSSEASESYLLPEPMGPLLAIMPWNFPFWQLFRFAVPSMLTGNTVLLKHAPNVPKCSGRIEQLFLDAGFPVGALTNHFLSNDGVASLIASPVIAGVAFTGSDLTGSVIGSLAGKSLKKSVMELGGNDPMIVFSDSDLEKAVAAAVASRCINGGQACNGAKRFLVQKEVVSDFTDRLSVLLSEIRMGDPMETSTQLGPIARFDLLEKVRRQVADTLAQGADTAFQPRTVPADSWFFPPTLLTGVIPGMTAFEEEIFGPVWSVTSFRDLEDAVMLANASRFGLGAAVWINDRSIAERMITSMETGNVFINDFVRSDPRFAFGGVKRSGYGKELGEAGLLEFVNWKTVWKA